MVPSFMGDSTTMKARFSGGGGESEPSLLPRPPLPCCCALDDAGCCWSESKVAAVRFTPLPVLDTAADIACVCVCVCWYNEASFFKQNWSVLSSCLKVE